MWTVHTKRVSILGAGKHIVRLSVWSTWVRCSRSVQYKISASVNLLVPQMSTELTLACEIYGEEDCWRRVPEKIWRCESEEPHAHRECHKRENTGTHDEKPPGAVVQYLLGGQKREKDNGNRG